MTEAVPGGAEALRWARFGRALILLFAGLTLLLGAGLTVSSGMRMRLLLERSFLERGETIGAGAARAAYVPLSLEDEEALAELASQYEGRSDLASLRVLDDAGRQWAAYASPHPPGARTLDVEIPIAPPRGGAVVGRVEVRMDPARISREVSRQFAASVAINGALALLIAAAGAAIVRKLTGRMRELAAEAARVEELRRSNRELEEFAYIASHDLQAPLRKIAGFAQLLQERYAGRLDSEADDHIGRIVAGAARMQRLIQDLLAYSRVGSRQLRPEKVETGEVLRQVLSDLEPLLRESGAKVTAGPLPALVGDAGQLGQLFQNLVTNGVKFRGDKPPEVAVAARREGAEWLFTVRDNGIGIEPQYADQVFKMFRRLNAPNAYPGTGIGLAVARKIVERHGGRIWVESRPGEGAAFRFTLSASGVPEEAPRG